jgi:hypothetical protein
MIGGRSTNLWFLEASRPRSNSEWIDQPELRTKRLYAEASGKHSKLDLSRSGGIAGSGPVCIGSRCCLAASIFWHGIDLLLLDAEVHRCYTRSRL